MDPLLAVVDLGSNSFRLAFGRVVQEGNTTKIYQIEQFREAVRLAAGLDVDKHLSAQAMERALKALKNFGKKLRSFHPARVRVVATNTFRVARNSAEFLPRAEAALGFPIEVIAGHEEARLIFSGVAHALPPSDHKRLVIDIGGGSTEIIIGKGYEPMLVSSLYMGCVGYSRQFFKDGVVNAYRFKQATLAARREIERITKRYRRLGWKQVYGSAGTARALHTILTTCGFSQGGITRAGLKQLKDRIVQEGRIVLDDLPGIKEERAAVLPGGLAIMIALFEELDIKIMYPGDGELRLGVLYDLLERDDQHDKRDESVWQFMKRYAVDSQQAARVRATALSLFQGLGVSTPAHDELVHALGWAADLHEIGMSIAHNDYHKHSAYILGHADMPGFSRDDQQLLAMLVLGHQGKLAKLHLLVRSREQWLAILCLRLAVLLCRRRQDIPGLPLTASSIDASILVQVDEAWLLTQPLYDFILKAEESEWGKIGFSFELRHR